MLKKILQNTTVLPLTTLALSVSTVVSTATPAGAFVPLTPTPTARPVRSIPALSYHCRAANPSACPAGQNQFRTKVSQYSPNQVLFSFYNSGSIASSITQIYFEDTGFKTLGKVARIFNGSGVSFNQPKSGNANSLLLGGTVTGANSFSFKANNNSSVNGINNQISPQPTEFLAILFDVVPGFGDPFNAVVTDLRRRTLRIGLQANGFGGMRDFELSAAGSQNFENNAVPEPLTMVGSGIALGFGALLKRRKAALQKSES